MKDLTHNIAPVVALAAAARNADATSSAINLAGFESAAIEISVGVGGITFDDTNKVEYKVTHSDDDSTYTAVAQADMQGTTVGSGGIVKTLNAAHAAGAVYTYGYVGGKKYLKVQADFSGTHGTATPMAVNIIKGHPANAPTN